MPFGSARMSALGGVAALAEQGRFGLADEQADVGAARRSRVSKREQLRRLAAVDQRHRPAPLVGIIGELGRIDVAEIHDEARPERLAGTNCAIWPEKAKIVPIGRSASMRSTKPRIAALSNRRRARPARRASSAPSRRPRPCRAPDLDMRLAERAAHRLAQRRRDGRRRPRRRRSRRDGPARARRDA